MQLWGRWYALDITRQLPPRLSAQYLPPRSMREKAPENAREAVDAAARKPADLDIHSWIRACGLACGYGSCINPRQAEKAGLEYIQVCRDWLDGSAANPQAVHAWANEQLVKAGRKRLRGEALLEAIFEHAVAKAKVPSALLAAAASARAAHPAALIALSRPVRAQSKVDYQMFVHLLHSAAMLTSRRPVIPLAHCTPGGDLAERSRCMWVAHSVAPSNSSWCMMRPSSECLDRVAIPTIIEDIPKEDTAVLSVPLLGLRDLKPDGVGFARALAAADVSKQLLLIDTSPLRAFEDVSNLLISTPGWLCNLEKTHCQNVC